MLKEQRLFGILVIVVLTEERVNGSEMGLNSTKTNELCSHDCNKTSQDPRTDNATHELGSA